MMILQVLGWTVVVVMILLILAWLFKPELLTLPFTAFTSIFVKKPPIVDREAYYHGSRLLEENWETIWDELIEVLKNAGAIPKFYEVDNIQRVLTGRDDIPWRTFGIKAFDRWIEPNASMVPETTALLKQVVDKATMAMFSILDGGKHIARHFGFFKGVFRYHLGLIVPTDAPCYIICGG